MTFAAGFLLHDVVLAGCVLVGPELFLLLLFVARGQFLGEGEHGEDNQQHGDGAQQKAAPPEEKRQEIRMYSRLDLLLVVRKKKNLTSFRQSEGHSDQN